MSPPGRPKGEYRSAQREGCLRSPPGRPKGEYRSAQREGCLRRTALRADRVGWRRQALCIATLSLVPIAAQADLWSIENSLSSRLEWNDNAALAQRSPGSVNTLSLSNALNASRQLENSVTRMKADVTALREQGPGAQDRIDGRLALKQAFSDPLNTFDLGAQYSQDFNDVVSSADVTQGQGRRRATLLSAAWSRALSERLSASTQLSAGRTGYGQALPGAVGFRDTALSGGVSYALSETSSLSLQASRSGYRAADDSNRSTTDAVNLSVSGAISDRASGSVSLGVYRTASEALGARLACPLAAALCNAGLVPFVIVSERVDSSRRGLQFSASVRYQVDQTTDSSFSVARQQVPSGAGTLVRSDTLSAGINRSLSPTLSGSVNYVYSRSTLQQGGGAARPGQQTLALSLSKQLAPELSLQAGYQRSESSPSGHGGGARSNRVSVALKYDWSRFDASR